MSTIHIVQEGEWLQKIAEIYKFKSWRTLYYHPENEALRQSRPDPNVLFVGDEVVIPERETSYVPLSTGQSYTVRTTFDDRDTLRIRPRGPSGYTLAGRPFVLNIGGHETSGTVPSGGLVEQEIPPGVSEAVLTVWLDIEQTMPCTWTIRVGFLNPIDTVSGVKARLASLQQYFGPIDEIQDDSLAHALRSFQRAEGIFVDGELSQITKTRLLQRYGC